MKKTMHEKSILILLAIMFFCTWSGCGKGMFDYGSKVGKIEGGLFNWHE